VTVTKYRKVFCPWCRAKRSLNKDNTFRRHQNLSSQRTCLSFEKTQEEAQKEYEENEAILKAERQLVSSKAMNQPRPPIPHQALRDACRNVLACWEEGDLAGAINTMERELDLIEGVTPRTKKLDEQVLLDTIQDCWHFIENVTQEDPARTDKFFALRKKVREVTWNRS